LIVPNVFETTDAVANTGTTYSLTAGQAAQGTIATNGDHDWYSVGLTAGQTYTFALVGTGATCRIRICSFTDRAAPPSLRRTTTACRATIRSSPTPLPRAAPITSMPGRRETPVAGNTAYRSPPVAALRSMCRWVPV